MHSQFAYDPLSGVVTLLTNRGNYKAGHVCKAVDTTGRYYKAKYNGKSVLLHRLAWELHTGAPPPNSIDHINGNGHDNRWCNLRAATTSENQMNIQVTSKSLTGLKGVFPVRGGKLYRAEVCVLGVRHQKHGTDVAALVRWVEAKRNELHGKFVCH